MILKRSKAIFCTLFAIQIGLISGLRQEEFLDANGKYLFGWEVDFELKEIRFDVKVQTKGFVGFGLSPTGSMAGADIVLGGVNDDGSVYFSDRHATGMTMPIEDKIQNWDLISISENNTHTNIEFKRKLDTCDSEDFIIDESTTRVIWSFGESDELKHHEENRGTKQFNFLDLPSPPEDISKYLRWSVRVNDLMPSADTTYQCSMHKAPQFEQKNHIVGFSAFLPSPEALKHTHHFIAAKCTAPDGADPDELFSEYVGQPGWDCDLNMEIKSHCTSFIYVWAVGGRMFFLPDDVGYPIGELAANEYFMLEIHYDNPDEREGVIFETGFDAYYTNELRPMEADLLNVGYELFSTQIIPPQSEDYVIAGHCSPQCTQERVPQEGINLFNVLLHSHLAGRKLRLRHFRDSVELPWIGNDEAYDFNFQQNRPLREEVKILPGDQLTLECTYDSMGRVNATLAGEATYEEMCLSYIYYWPRIKLAACSSFAYPPEDIFSSFGIEEVDWTTNGLNPTILKPDHLAGKTLSEVLNTHVDWTEDLRNEVENKIRYGEHWGICYHPSDPIEEIRRNNFTLNLINKQRKSENIDKTLEALQNDPYPIVQYPELDSEYERPRSECHDIVPENRYRYTWTVDQEKQEITFNIEVDTKGFIGFGLSRDGKMLGSDIVIGGVFDNGTSYFSDRHGVGNREPQIDQVQDWLLVEAREENFTTYLTIKRAFDTCDEAEDIAINEDTLRVIWSFGETDEIKYHGANNRGGKSVYLLDPVRPIFDESKYQNFTLSSTIEMPSDHTTYWCTVHKSPTFDKKYHVVAFKPKLVTPEAIKHTHHFGAYRCIPPEGVDADDFFGPYLNHPGGHCFSAQDPIQVPRMYCQSFLYIWAVGGEMMILPDEAGYPIGDGTTHEYYLLDIHYDNVENLAGLTIETAVEVFYTDELRPNDASVLVVGHDLTPTMIIPPISHNWEAVGHCSSQCTQEYFPQEGITAFNVMLHSHLAGKKMKLRHFRDGKELPWISVDNNYDFNYQQNRPLKNSIQILPGDHMTYECNYDTRWNGGHVTLSGESTREEMCYSFLWYYPKVPMEVCLSQSMPNNGNLDDYLKKFGIQGHTWEGVDSILLNNPIITAPSVIEGLRFEDVVQNFTFWSVDLRNELQTDMKSGSHIAHCFGQTLIPPEDEIWVKYPEIDSIYEPPVSEHCPLDTTDESPTTTSQGPVPTTDGGVKSTVPAFITILILPIISVGQFVMQ